MGLKNEKKYITLKEAADISGYASDYVGQLIRAGKLEGKQVYNSVAWMTTKEAVKEYINKTKEKNDLTFLPKSIAHFFQLLRNGVTLREYSVKAFRISLYFIIALSVLVALLLFYILSSSIEAKLQKNAEEQLQLRSFESYAE